MHAGLGVGVGWRGQVWAYMSKGGLVRMRQTDWAGMDGVGGFGYACRSKGGCGWAWASFGRYEQGWAKVGRSG